MPFFSARLYLWFSTATVVAVLIAIAAFAASAEHRAREYQQADEALREAAILAAVVESAAARSPTTAHFAIAMDAVAAAAAPHAVFVVRPDGAVFGRSPRTYAACSSPDEPSCAVLAGHPAAVAALAAAGAGSGALRVEDEQWVAEAAVREEHAATFAAYVSIPALNATLVVQRSADVGALGAVAGTYAAATVACIVAVYVLAWAAAERLAHAPGMLVAGGVCVALAQFVPLAFVALFIAVAKSTVGPARFAHLDAAAATLGAVTAAIDAVGETLAPQDAIAAVAALASLQATGFARSLHTGLWVQGTPAVGLPANFDVFAAPSASLSGDVAVVSGPAGPDRTRVVYVSDAQLHRAVPDAVARYALPVCAALGVALLLPASPGGTVRARFAGFPHFVSPGSPGVVAAAIAMLIAVLIPTGALMQHAEAARSATAAAGADVRDAVKKCASAVGLSRWQLNAAAVAALGPQAGVFTLAGLEAPAEHAAVLADAVVMYQGAAAVRSEMQALLSSLRPNASALVGGRATAETVIAMGEATQAAYRAAAAVLNADTVLGSHVWRGRAAMYNSEENAVLAAARTAATTLAAEYHGIAGDAAVDAIAARAAGTVATAVRDATSRAATPGSSVRTAAIADFSIPTARAASEYVAASSRAAKSRIELAKRRVPRPGASEAAAVDAMAAAGYAAVVVCAFVALLTVVLHVGVSSRRALLLTAAPLGAMLVFCFVVRAASSEATAAVREWAQQAGTAVDAAPWQQDCIRALNAADCGAVTVLGAFLGNYTAPPGSSATCRSAMYSVPTRAGSSGGMRAAVTAVVGLHGVGSTPSAATVYTAVAATNTQRTTADALITGTAAQCPAANASTVAYSVAAMTRLARRVAIIADSTATATSAIAAFRDAEAAAGTAAAAAGCSTNVTMAITRLAALAEAEMYSALSAGLGASWYHVLLAFGPRTDAHAVAVRPVAWDAAPAAGSGSGHHVTAIGWMTILSAWAVSAAAVWVHRGATAVVLRRDNAADFEE